MRLFKRRARGSGRCPSRFFVDKGSREANFDFVSHAIKYKHFCDYPSNCNNAIASAEVKMIRFKSRIIYLSPISKVTAGGSAFELLMPIPACQQEAIQVVIIFCK